MRWLKRRLLKLERLHDDLWNRQQFATTTFHGPIRGPRMYARIQGSIEKVEREITEVEAELKGRWNEPVPASMDAWWDD